MSSILRTHLRKSGLWRRAGVDLRTGKTVAVEGYGRDIDKEATPLWAIQGSTPSRAYRRRFANLDRARMLGRHRKKDATVVETPEGPVAVETVRKPKETP